MVKELLMSVLTGLLLFSHGPNTTVKAPTVRYHGYALNRAAIQRAKVFTVIISQEGFGSISRGTGVLLDSKHVLTCAHVAHLVNDELRVFIYPGNISLPAKTVFQSGSKDLAILELDGSVNGAPTPVFSDYEYDGQPITIIGNILGSMKWFVSYGIISGRNERDLYTDGLVLGGDSGGPWINERGEVVAISDWALVVNGKHAGINGGVSSKTIRAFLHDWKHPSLFQLLLG